MAAPAATRGGARRAPASPRGVEGRAWRRLERAGSERAAGGSPEERWDSGNEFCSFPVELSEAQGRGASPPEALGLGIRWLRFGEWGRGQFEAQVTQLQGLLP